MRVISQSPSISLRTGLRLRSLLLRQLADQGRFQEVLETKTEALLPPFPLKERVFEITVPPFAVGYLIFSF
ncbi:MAG: hypothetical protein A2900_02755 [Candidatus Chisholmbacteria bacterium RIFCSPLOWO2_01_FULL_50_28]|uniref:Uncharacterized protein n=1 Tax=Candidatus Chisholmbacteria bacterium RIFCSPHIGHO2_01_FULL_52_32 TaxID=1797591 RepID=A0A1G1VTB8_9BACT|nr:MAG: hypothetical protein A2786_03990 [Candidatus Chisholmbacteria bacterium RIFCSPHIGHO2_01_FULL_52_32]OGY19997.1 MAG: hypothetical protein A2900_02755 [Candidatus Chisholmbacteria bacterium RIFCSPLOWO2_01_FULL_50_28]